MACDHEIIKTDTAWHSSAKQVKSATMTLEFITSFTTNANYGVLIETDCIDLHYINRNW